MLFLPVRGQTRGRGWLDVASQLFPHGGWAYPARERGGTIQTDLHT